MKNIEIEKIIKNALNEDIGSGDITTIACVPEDAKITGSFIAKKGGIICGLDIAEMIFSFLSDEIEFKKNICDGKPAKEGETIAQVSGNARAILSGERTALNLMQRLSGIATATNNAVLAVKGTQAKITDTRKTTPGLRVLEKYAVRTGGGVNHRFNLTDGVLIKDNHIKASGGITNAVNAARQNAPHMLKIEVETTNMAEITEALSCKADVIMLDNMSYDEMRQAVLYIDGRALVEASGNMGEKDLLKVAQTGVDLISIGALTHTITALDISLKFL